MSDSVQHSVVSRAHAAAEHGIDRLLEEIDVVDALEAMSRSAVYYGEWCCKCRCDTVPMPDGRCGWCGTKVVDPVE